MRRNESGISLVEVVIALAIVMLVLYAAITFFIGTVRQYKVQTKIVETNVEGILGLELLRRDVESLGFGLHWDNGVSDTERTGVPPRSWPWTNRRRPRAPWAASTARRSRSTIPITS